MDNFLKRKIRNNGFTLVELVVAIAVLSILSAVSIPNFICFPRKARATAALTSLKQVYKECLAKNIDNINQNFIPNNYSVNGYSFQSNEDFFCQGDSNGLISIEPQDLNTYPVFNIAVVSGEMSYTYKGAPGTDLKECLAMICIDGIYKSQRIGIDEFENKFNDAFTDGLTLDGEYYRRGDSVYVIVKGDTWEKAQANAKKLGGNLATINNEEENSWLQSQLYGDGKASNKLTDQLGLPGEELRGSSVWLGHTNHQNNEKYESVTGEKNTYSNWAPGEESDGFGKGEKYTVMALFDNYNRDPGQMMTVSNRQYNTDQLVERGGAHIFYGLAEIKTNEIMEVDDDEV